MQKTDIWMPLYIGDYLADTARLTTEQHGAYLLLLMDYWRSGKLPDNDQVLSQITKLSPDAWSNAKAMLKQFFSIEDGFWIHKRVEQELVASIENKAKNHKRAVSAAKARWGKQQKDATSNAKAMLEECPSPSPSPSSNNDIDVAKATKPTRGSRFKEDLLPKEWEQFCLKERPDLQPNVVFIDFKDYWVSVAGQKGVRADWFATWRGWVRRQHVQKTQAKTQSDKTKDVLKGLTRGLLGGENDVGLLGK